LVALSTAYSNFKLPVTNFSIMYTAEYFIDKLGLEAHIEGGYFKEIYRNSFEISSEGFSHALEGKRSLSTTIYFLLKSGQVSKFHQLKSDEIWFYHYGCPILIHMIDENGDYKCVRLGLHLEAVEMPQILIPANVIFGAEPLNDNSFSLVSCMVSPGFDFRDFKLFEANELSLMFPKYLEIIQKLNG
jgi:uncharacterized protein